MFKTQLQAMSINKDIPDELINKQLVSILGYEEIKHSQILSRFLSFVVEKKILKREEEIKEYTIGVKGLGKPSDFNPQLDASVRIHAGRLRKVLQQYYTGPGKNDRVLIDIPKGSYIPVFENRDNGNGNGISIKEPLPEITKPTHVPPSNGHSKPVIAVLPFHNLSSDHSKEYFVTGLGEQLSTDLARFQNISVISYYSTHNYDSALMDLHEMKKSSNVDYVLMGSVRFINELVRLNVQLVLSENGQIVFTETYSRHLEPENMFDVQEEITGEILNVIADDNGIIAMNNTVAYSSTSAENLSVQEAIFKYFDYNSDYNNQKFESTIHSMEQAVAIEPHNALACALLSSLYMYSYCTKKELDTPLLEKAFELAQASVRLDPQCQHAQKALAWSLLLNNKKEKSLEVIERCIKLNPKASSITSLMALAYIYLGEYTQGFKWLLETIHLNPVIHVSSKFALCLYYFQTGNYSESLRWMERLHSVETPLFTLIRSALLGKVHKKKLAQDNIAELENDALSIIDRSIFDPALKADVIDGLKLAGLVQ